MKQFARQTKFHLMPCLFISLVFWIYVSVAFADPIADEHIEDVYPVINTDNVHTEISRNGLSAIFKMRLRKWNDGTPVSVFVLKDDHPLHIQFSKLVLNVFPHQLRRAWNKTVFSGSGQAPRELESTQDMIEKISNIPGSIGYLREIDMNENIQILTVR